MVCRRANRNAEVFGKNEVIRPLVSREKGMVSLQDQDIMSASVLRSRGRRPPQASISGATDATVRYVQMEDQVFFLARGARRPERPS